jgi:hypothetical protein
MNKILHIINGDATLRSFEQTGLDGDILVWREVLSEGPVTEDILSAAFWQHRSAWICKTFKETPTGYQNSVITHLEILSRDYEVINLWFEFDLHCQINMLGVMMLLSRQTDLTERAIYLISPDTFPGKINFKGMGELNGEELTYLYDNIRIQLSAYDFALAAEAWEIYKTGDAVRLQEWLSNTAFWGGLHMLQPAMQAQLKRLQLNAQSLNFIHQKLLDIYNSGVHKRADIYITFWATEKIYGMGDSEIDFYLQQLADRGFISLND